MKALSLVWPWSELVARGLKKIETRSWGVHHRGIVAVHASRTMLTSDEYAELHPAVRQEIVGLDASRRSAVRGAIVALAGPLLVVPMRGWRPAPPELHLGNYADDRYAWMLDEVLALPRPVPCSGSLGLWDVPPIIEHEIVAQVLTHTTWQSWCRKGVAR